MDQVYQGPSSQARSSKESAISTYQHVKDVLAENILAASFQHHVLVLWKDQIAKHLQAPLREIEIHNWILRVQLGQSPLEAEEELVGSGVAFIAGGTSQDQAPYQSAAIE